MKRILIVFLLLAAASAHVAAQEKFPMITIPEEITDHVARAKYLGEHYWDNVDFNTASDEVLEQGFVDMVSIFMLLDDEALDRMQERMAKATDGRYAAMPDSVREAYRTAGGTPHLDGQYTVFGRVAEGLETVEAIQRTPTDSLDRPVTDVRILRARVER